MPLQDGPANAEPIPVAASLLPLLNHLRLTALGCRCAARADLFEACALLSSDKGQARDAYAEALIRCLGQALDNPPLFFRPGVSEVSFDEAWLMRLVAAFQGDDTASAAFLICSRVPKVHRRNLAFLAHSVSDQFRQI
ncbi:hypothetical protein CFI11_04465 [Thalassococcus sp. S3]|nr:hypothetical protein CFI11_04465 [Thalassococcus sp. S3]